MVDSVSSEFVYFPFENLNGTYRTFTGERATGVSWDKNDTIMLGTNGKWIKVPTSHGTGSPWFVSSDIGAGVTSFTVNEAPYIRLMPPKFKQRGLPGMIADSSDLIWDFGEVNNSVMYAINSTKVSATLPVDMAVVPGTKGYISMNKLSQNHFTREYTYPAGNTYRARGVATSSASKAGDVVECFMVPQGPWDNIASVYEGDNSSRWTSPMAVAEVTGGFTMAIPISGGEYVQYSGGSATLFEHPFIYNYGGNRLKDMPRNDLFKDDSQYLCSPVFICKSRKEAMVAGITHMMIGLVDDDDGNPTGQIAYMTDTLTIPSLSWFSPTPNTVTKDYLNALLIAKDVPAEAIPTKFNSDQDIKSIVWSFAHRGRAIPCTNAPLGAQEELPETHKLNFFRGPTPRMLNAPSQYSAMEVDGKLDKGYVYNNCMQYGGASEDYYDSYTNNQDYFSQLRNGSCKGIGWLFAGNIDFGLTGVNSATIGTRHGSGTFNGVVIPRAAMGNGGNWTNDTNWFTQFFSTGGKLLPDCHEDAFIGPIDYNGSPISISWKGSVKDGSLDPGEGVIFRAFPHNARVYRNHNPAQPFPYDVRKIVARIANTPLGTPKPESEMVFESDHLFHKRAEDEERPVVTKVGNNITMTATRTVNGTSIFGYMDNYATYDNSTSRYGTLDFRPPGAFARGIFWLEKEVEGKTVKYYIQQGNIVSKYPIWMYTTCWSSEQHVFLGPRTAKNWSYGFGLLPGTNAAAPGDIHYKIELMLEIADWSVGNYKNNNLYSLEPRARNCPNIRWEFEGKI